VSHRLTCSDNIRETAIKTCRASFRLPSEAGVEFGNRALQGIDRRLATAVQVAICSTSCTATQIE
jgi:hypothetical protein